MGKKKLSRFSNLIYDKARFITAPNLNKGYLANRFLTLEEVSDPKYDPWIKVWAYTAKRSNGYEFFYHPKSETIYYKTKNHIPSGGGNKNPAYRKIKKTTKVYKEILKGVSSKEPVVIKKRNSLDAGFIYTPYIPKFFKS